jgi:hypothetical protein
MLQEGSKPRCTEPSLNTRWFSAFNLSLRERNYPSLSDQSRLRPPSIGWYISSPACVCELHVQSFYPHTKDFDACIYQSLGEFCPLLGWPPTSDIAH